VASGSELGAIALGGLRFSGESLTGGVEIRFQSADADLGARFSGPVREPRIDLSGWTYLFTMGVRFWN
jgi:hypothetical protein